MFAEWLEDLESLEAISQDAEARTILRASRRLLSLSGTASTARA